jgi:uncharacterized small protein (DUF1192 family)
MIERAKERVRATLEHRWLEANTHHGVSVEAAPTCPRADCDVRVSVLAGDTIHYSFLVRAGGSLAVELAAAAPVPYEAWSIAEQQRLAALEDEIKRLGANIAKLPEVRAFGRRSAANGGTLVVWLESLPRPGCTAEQDDCVFELYAGEVLNGHATRWATFRVAKYGEAMSVSSLDQMEPQPYAVWRKHRHR